MIMASQSQAGVAVANRGEKLMHGQLRGNYNSQALVPQASMLH